MSTNGFITGTEAARILGVHRHAIPPLVTEGVLAVRSLPRTRRRFDRNEVQALAGKMTRHGATS